MNKSIMHLWSVSPSPYDHLHPRMGLLRRLFHLSVAGPPRGALHPRHALAQHLQLLCQWAGSCALRRMASPFMWTMSEVPLPGSGQSCLLTSKLPGHCRSIACPQPNAL